MTRQPDYPTPLHQASADLRHAATRNEANGLITAARLHAAPGSGHTSDTAVAFGQHEIAEAVMRIAPCGCWPDVLAGAVMLAAELALRLAATPATGRR